MLLEKKVAVIYGAVARAFVREGATAVLAGRTKAKLDKIADEIRANGGSAQTAVVDALHEEDVDQFVDEVVEQAGHIDISFNLIGYDDVQKPLPEISVEDFLQPIMDAMRAQFLTTRAADMDGNKLEARSLELKGISGPVPVRVLHGNQV
ncbi:MAG: SDR family NAD(P)-dependent oxidoreductase [Nitrospira sp.]